MHLMARHVPLMAIDYILVARSRSGLALGYFIILNIEFKDVSKIHD